MAKKKRTDPIERLKKREKRLHAKLAKGADREVKKQLKRAQRKRRRLAAAAAPPAKKKEEAS